MTMIRKAVANTGTGLDFVLSDATVDRYGDIIEPAGWDLKWFKKNPIALFGHSNSFPIGTWKNVRIEGGKLIASLALAARGTSARIDELISLVEQGVLRAVSVGFIPRKSEPINPEKPYQGLRFLEQELLECSLVSVPANPAALQVAKSMNVSDEIMSLAFGEQAETVLRDVSIGEHAATSPHHSRGNIMNIAQRIDLAQKTYNEARDAYEAHVSEDDFDIEQADALKSEMEAREARLTALKDVETSLGRSAAGLGNGQQQQQRNSGNQHQQRKPLAIREREPKPGDLVVRTAVCTVLANVLGRDPISILEERYRDHEATNVFVRAAVDPGKTTVSGWASELVETETVAFLETLRDISFYPMLAARGANLQFGAGRGIIKIPARAATPSVAGSFVGEGAPIPVRRIGLGSKTLSPHKMGVISYFTKELAKYSNPQIENLLRTEIRGDTAETLDTLLIDTTAASAVRPAGLLNGISALVPSTAGGWLAIMEDIDTLAAPFDAAKAGRDLVLLMNKRENRRLSFMAGPDGKIGSMRQVLIDAGITPIASVNVPAGRLVMLDAADFATAAGDQPEFEASEQAVIHAEDTSPQQIGTAGTPNVAAAPTISMFQTDSIALRMLLDVTWTMRRDGMVQWIDDVDWAFTDA